MIKLKKKKNKKRKEKELVNIRSSFDIGPQEIPFLTTNLLNVTQLECFTLDFLSDFGINLHDRSSTNIIEHNECRFSNI